ncbi:MAG: YtxH domain-containing protein [Chloroflexota bacterium]|nr:YtxH domain-containing protein [Chloroflexota bacterium]
MRDRIYYSKEAEQRARRAGVTIAVLATLLGASAGVIIALLFAPRSGDEIRGELSRTVDRAIDGARSSSENLGETAGRALNQVRERIEDTINHA